MKFIKSLHIVAKTQQKMIILPLRQYWSESDTSYFTTPAYLNQKGLSIFCQALDATTRFADTRLMRNHGMSISQVFQKDKLQEQMEQRLIKFETGSTSLGTSSTVSLPDHPRQRQLNEQFQQIRNFFESRRFSPNVVKTTYNRTKNNNTTGATAQTNQDADVVYSIANSK